MAKRRAEDECSEETPKKYKSMLDTPHSDADILVPDTPQNQMKKRPALQPLQSTPAKASKPAAVSEDTPVKAAVSEATPVKAAVSDAADSDDEFSDDDIDVAVLDKIANTYEGYGRYTRVKVEAVEDCGDKKLVYCTRTGEAGQLCLKVSGEWYYSDISPGCFVHLVCESPASTEMEISNCSSTLLVIHPDILVSPTTISSSVRCLRQAVLGEVFKPTVGFSSNEVMLLGTINHSLFDAAVRSQQFQVPYLRKQLDTILEHDEIVDSLCCMGLGKADLLKKLLPSLELIVAWGKQFCLGEGDSVSYGQKGDEQTRVDKIIDIEENVWSPKYGCKGKIDATVRIHTPGKAKLSPIEVKSGLSKSSLGSVDHRAQVILYTMMLEERYKERVDSGILYYIKGRQTIGVPSSSVERRALVIKRNDVAGALHDILVKEKMKLPDLTSDRMACKYCNHQLSCSLAYKAFEAKGAHPFPEMLENNTSQLTDNHLEYFRKFSKLCIQEAQVSRTSAKMPWDEACRRYAKLTLLSVSSKHGYAHTFKFPKDINVRSSFMKLGDYVILSREDGSAYNIAAGFVTSLSACELEVYMSDVDMTASPHHRPGPSYTVTKHSSLSGLHTSLGNVTSFLSSTERSAKWRRLLVDGAKPQFTQQLFSYTQEARVSDSTDKLLMSLNAEQRRAVERAIAAEDYLCILGMPGTGKTTTISCLIQLLVARGHTVLLTAYTHSAVDNLVIKLPDSVDLVRLGAPGRIHASNKHRSSHALTEHITDPKDLRAFYDAKAVVATTCLGMRHSVFEYKSFDYCIVDEASQITQPICLGPLLHSDRCILVGDHNQLPPLVQNQAAKENGLGRSLFQHLCDLHPTAGVCELGIQYRMCSDIMLLANTLVYGGKLKCADEQVARSVLEVKAVSGEAVSGDPCPDFVKRCLRSSTKVLFLDTSQLGSTESAASGSISNPVEAKIVKLLCTNLALAGVSERDVGVLSPYNGQLQLLSDMLHPDIELLTADRYQGRDKPCIVISFTRSNATRTVGPLLEDRARLNVALTRAKSKLLMVGNLDTLAGGAVLGQLAGLLRKKSWVLQLDHLPG